MEGFRQPLVEVFVAFGQFLGNIHQLIPGLGDRQSFLFQQVSPIIQGIHIEVVQRGDNLVVEGDRLQRAGRVSLIPGGPIEFTAGKRLQVGERTQRRELGQPGHVGGDDVRRRAARQHHIQFLKGGIPIQPFVLDGNVGIFFLESLE